MDKVSRSDIKLGEPLPFSIHDTDGRLLLRRGFVITMPNHIEQLIARGVLMGEKSGGGGRTSSSSASPSAASHGGAPKAESLPVYDQMDGLVLNLKHIFTISLKSPEQIDLPVRIKGLASNIQAFCHEDLDSALAAPYLDIHNPYIIVHQVMGAILTEIIAGRKGLSAADRLIL